MSQQAKLIAVVAVTLWMADCSRREVVQAFPESFVGVGLELTMQGSGPVVVRALPGGPAALAGVEPGDRLLLIDGVELAGWTLGDVVMRLRGAPDSQTALTLDRKGHRIIVVVRRTAMQKATVDYQPSH